MKRKQTKTEPKPSPSGLDDAMDVVSMLRRRLDTCDPDDTAKITDAWARASNVARQLTKDRKRALSEFSDDEIAEYIRGLPERRRDAIISAVQATSLAGKPLFG